MEYSIDYYKNLFVVKMAELERCHSEMSNYSLIQSSNPMRFLLFDSQPLVDILNREKKLPLTYTINNDDWHANEQGIAVLNWRELSPSLALTTKSLKKDAFFKEPCVFYMDSPITVLEVIKFYAYCRGGIHLDKGQAEYDKHRTAFEAIKLNGISSLDHSMRAILQIVLSTLTEFKERLLS